MNNHCVLWLFTILVGAIGAAWGCGQSLAGYPAPNLEKAMEIRTVLASKAEGACCRWRSAGRGPRRAVGVRSRTIRL